MTNSRQTMADLSMAETMAETETAHALPGRRKRLAVFRRLKEERHLLRGLLAAGLFLAAGSVAFDAATPDPAMTVSLGTGKAGIDTDLKAVEAPATMATRSDTLLDEVEEAAENALHAAAKEIGIGEASFYGERFAGRPTANGDIFDPALMTAAHRTLPMGSRVRVTHVRSGETVVVRINDRGPFHGQRVIDLSRAAAKKLGMVKTGTARVKLELLPKA